MSKAANTESGTMTIHTHITGGILPESAAKTTPLWMAEDGLADESNEARKAKIRIDIKNIKGAQAL